MQRRRFLISGAASCIALTSMRISAAGVHSYDQADWQPELLKKARQAIVEPRINRFLDALGLPTYPDGDATSEEITYLLGLQRVRASNAKLISVVREQNDQPIEWMLETSLGEAVQDIDRQRLKAACDAIEPFILAAKYRFMRVRPSKTDSRIQPLLAVPGHPSYPSGHATQGYLCAEVLAMHHPQKAAICREAGISIGLGREVAGLHFPSDGVAGRLLAAEFCRQYSF